jgi:hypothetical protein
VSLHITSTEGIYAKSTGIRQDWNLSRSAIVSCKPQRPLQVRVMTTPRPNYSNRPAHVRSPDHRTSTNKDRASGTAGLNSRSPSFHEIAQGSYFVPACATSPITGQAAAPSRLPIPSHPPMKETNDQEKCIVSIQSGHSLIVTSLSIHTKYPHRAVYHIQSKSQVPYPTQPPVPLPISNHPGSNFRLNSARCLKTDRFV